jgi:hypothetical protein
MMPVSRQIKTVIRVGPGGDAVTAGIRKARKAWDEYQANAEFSRDAVYGYLQVVFDIIQGWKREGVADEYTLKALKQHDFPIRMKADPFGRLIYCSTGTWDNPQMRSKWANVMQWVAKHNKKARSFTEFVTKNGGLNKCADLARDGFGPDWT